MTAPLEPHRAAPHAPERGLGSSGVLGPWRYEFLVPGELSAATARAFPELTPAPGPLGGTALYGEVRDQSHLQGLLARFADLSLVVVEMRRLPG